MKTPTLRPLPRSRLIDAKPLRFRAELPAVNSGTHAILACAAAHDFLVPNPRPDLTFDPLTLRMIEAG